MQLDSKNTYCHADNKPDKTGFKFTLGKTCLFW